jgi:hypothetical protein
MHVLFAFRLLVSGLRNYVTSGRLVSVHYDGTWRCAFHWKSEDILTQVRLLDEIEIELSQQH